jgi:hypothetical protein
MPAVRPGGEWLVHQTRRGLSARLSARMHALRLDALARFPAPGAGMRAGVPDLRLRGGGRSTVPRHTRITGRKISTTNTTRN